MAKMIEAVVRPQDFSKEISRLDSRFDDVFRALKNNEKSVSKLEKVIEH